MIGVVGLAYAQSPGEIIVKAQNHERGISSFAEMTISIIRPTWRRDMSLKIWSKGNDLAMVLVTAPAREKGIVYLKRKREVWNWIPAIERNIKLPPSMMSQSWMGTDFTNDDLVKEASIVDDYFHEFGGDTILLERSCYQILMRPRPEAGIVWGKVVVAVDKKDFMLLNVRYFDEDNKLVSTLVVREAKKMGGRMLPSIIEMIPADKKGHSTIMVYNALEFARPLDDNFFSVSNMKILK